MKLKIRISRLLAASLSVLFLGAALPVAAGAEVLELTAQDAVMMAIENNRSLQSQKYSPVLSDISITRAESSFDPLVSASLNHSESESSTGSKSRSTKESVGISKRLSTGANISADLSFSDSNSSSNSNTTGLSVSFTQPLLEDAGRDVTLAGLHQAELNRISVEYDLRGYVETLIQQVTNAYWNYALAVRRQAIYEESLQIAKLQLEETQAMVDVGKLAEVELVSAKAEVALKEQAMVDAESNVETLRIALLRLISPGPDRIDWSTDVMVLDYFELPEINLGDLETHIENAMKMRPDLNQARLSIENGNIDIVQTRNGLLPKLDFFITLGQTGYADSFSSSAGDLFSDASSFSTGLSFSYTLGNRSDRALFEQSMIKREQYDLALQNMEMLAEEELRKAWLEIDRSVRQVEAMRISNGLLEEKLRTEKEKYRVGRSTSLSVTQAQRDLQQGRENEAKAIADCYKALEAFEKSEGILMKQRGISVANTR